MASEVVLYSLGAIRCLLTAKLSFFSKLDKLVVLKILLIAILLFISSIDHNPNRGSWLCRCTVSCNAFMLDFVVVIGDSIDNVVRTQLYAM